MGRLGDRGSLVYGDRGWGGGGLAYHVANGTLDGPLATDAARASHNHVEDGALLETVRAFGARDGVLVREEGQRAFDADAFAGDGQVVVVVVFVGVISMGTGAGVAGWVEGRVGGEPSGWVGQRRCVVAGVQGVVDDALEADVGVVGRVAVHGSNGCKVSFLVHGA